MGARTPSRPAADRDQGERPLQCSFDKRIVHAFSMLCVAAAVGASLLRLNRAHDSYKVVWQEYLFYAIAFQMAVVVLVPWLTDSVLKLFDVHINRGATRWSVTMGGDCVFHPADPLRPSATRVKSE